ncbi:hypothetical protein BKA60DRAFT_41716 [Fusarium oxysporum]|nr:hypothetical protein BKA60DRAFT_41716 [Fusarium oxysporum]
MFISVLIASSYTFSLCVPPSGISILLIRPRTGQDISVGPKGNYPGFNAGSRGTTSFLSFSCNPSSGPYSPVWTRNEAILVSPA